MDRTELYSNISCPFPDCHSSFLFDSSLIFLFLSVETVRGRPLWGWPAMSVFLSSKSFILHQTPSASAHVSSHRILIRALIPDAGTSSLTRNSLNALFRNEMSSWGSFFFKYSTNTWRGQTTWFSFWCKQVRRNYSSCIVHCNTVWHLLVTARHLLVIAQCSSLSVLYS